MDDRYLAREGQPKLRYSVFAPSTPPRGAVFITPGFSEHVGRYERVASLWTGRGFVVAVHDPRGQGLSEGPRGHIVRFSDWVDDAGAILQALAQDPLWAGAGAPIAFGHSLGALITSHALLRPALGLRAFACSSPFFGLQLAPPSWQVVMAHLVNRVLPRYSEKTTLRGARLTHDPERARLIDTDPLGIERVTARWFLETQAAQRLIAARAAEVSVPVFCLQAELDHVVSPKTSRRVVESFPQGEWHSVPGCFHELHQEVNWQTSMGRFADRFEQWCPLTT